MEKLKILTISLGLMALILFSGCQNISYSDMDDCVKYFNSSIENFDKNNIKIFAKADHKTCCYDYDESICNPIKEIKQLYLK